jgi:hypothetical protein
MLKDNNFFLNNLLEICSLICSVEMYLSLWCNFLCKSLNFVIHSISEASLLRITLLYFTQDTNTC